MDEDIRRRAEGALGYVFKNPDLLTRALTHASIADSRLDSNERMEFLGDSILGMVVAERIFELYPDHLEGEMTKIRSTTVSRRTCAAIAKAIGLHDLLVIGKGMQGQYQLPPSLSAAALEAVIAAIYLDGGLQPVRAFVLPHVDPIIEAADASGHQQNFKSVLQQLAQQRFGDTPVYKVLDEKGPDHAKCFKIGVEINGQRFDPSWGQSKKQAEQQAALNALRQIGVVEDDEDGGVRVVLENED